MTNAGHVLFALDCNSSSVGVFLGSRFVLMQYIAVPVCSKEQTKTLEDAGQRNNTLQHTHHVTNSCLYVQWGTENNVPFYN